MEILTPIIMEKFSEASMLESYDFIVDPDDIQTTLEVESGLIGKVKLAAEGCFCHWERDDTKVIVQGSPSNMCSFMACVGYLRAHYPDSISAH